MEGEMKVRIMIVLLSADEGEVVNSVQWDVMHVGCMMVILPLRIHKYNIIDGTVGTRFRNCFVKEVYRFQSFIGALRSMVWYCVVGGGSWVGGGGVSRKWVLMLCYWVVLLSPPSLCWYVKFYTLSSRCNMCKYGAIWLIHHGNHLVWTLYEIFITLKSLLGSIHCCGRDVACQWFENAIFLLLLCKILHTKSPKWDSM